MCALRKSWTGCYPPTRNQLFVLVNSELNMKLIMTFDILVPLGPGGKLHSGVVMLPDDMNPILGANYTVTSHTVNK